MAGEDPDGCISRIKGNALSLVSAEKFQIDDDEVEDDSVWEFIERYLLLHSTLLFSDLSRLTSRVQDEGIKRSLSHIGNQLLCSIQEMQNAVKLRDLCSTHSCYGNVVFYLQELMPPLLRAKYW